MSSERLDRVSLTAGFACLLIAGMIGLDQFEVISLNLGLAAAAISAAAAFVLVASGSPSSRGAGRVVAPPRPAPAAVTPGPTTAVRDLGRPDPAIRADLRRDRDRGKAGGVLAGVGARLGIDPWLVRVVFVVGVVASRGALLVAYVVAWALLPDSDGTVSRFGAANRDSRLATGLGLLALASLLVLRDLGIWWSDAVTWPLVLVGAGLVLLWAQSRTTATATDPVGQAAIAAGPTVATRASLTTLYRGGFGIALVLGAALLFLSANNAIGAARDAALTAVVAIVALALILAPFLWRLGRSLATERAERIRSQERSEVAAHLHDSVLQTLTLMQKRSDDPREVAALARRQERELRSWLAGDRAGSEGGFAAGLRAVAEEVEDTRRVTVDYVAVGDCELDEDASSVVAAAREALTNAAKFAAGAPISVYAEVTDERIEVFVRDRGPGFSPDDVPEDRRGVRDSIIGRMRRRGGSASIRAVAGSGTEVALAIERREA